MKRLAIFIIFTTLLVACNHNGDDRIRHLQAQVVSYEKAAIADSLSASEPNNTSGNGYYIRYESPIRNPITKRPIFSGTYYVPRTYNALDSKIQNSMIQQNKMIEEMKRQLESFQTRTKWVDLSTLPTLLESQQWASSNSEEYETYTCQQVDTGDLEVEVEVESDVPDSTASCCD